MLSVFGSVEEVTRMPLAFEHFCRECILMLRMVTHELRCFIIFPVSSVNLFSCRGIILMRQLFADAMIHSINYYLVCN